MIIYNQTLKMSEKNYEVRNISYAVFYRFIYILINRLRTLYAVFTHKLHCLANKNIILLLYYFLSKGLGYIYCVGV